MGPRKGTYCQCPKWEGQASRRSLVGEHAHRGAGALEDPGSPLPRSTVTLSLHAGLGGGVRFRFPPASQSVSAQLCRARGILAVSSPPAPYVFDLPCRTVRRKVKTNADFKGFRRPLSRRKLRDPYSPSAASYSPSPLVVERGPGCHSHGQVCMTKRTALAILSVLQGVFCGVFCKVVCRVFARCFARWSAVFCRVSFCTIQSNGNKGQAHARRPSAAASVGRARWTFAALQLPDFSPCLLSRH